METPGRLREPTRLELVTTYHELTRHLDMKVLAVGVRELLTSERKMVIEKLRKFGEKESHERPEN